MAVIDIERPSSDSDEIFYGRVEVRPEDLLPHLRVHRRVVPPRPTRAVVQLHIGVVVGLLFLSLLAWWHVWFGGHPATTVSCMCGDSGQSIWFLAATPFSLLHGHSPLLSQSMYAGQGGVNLLVNTSWMLPGLLLAPITVFFGPVMAFNVATLLAPVLSGWCMFLLLRKFTRFLPAQLLGALLYGFSPFLVANDPYGAINLILLFFPPLVLLLLHDLVVTKRYRPEVIGLALALLTVAQFFTGTEILALTALLTAVGLIAAILMAPRQFWAGRRDIAIGMGSAVLIALGVLAYPIWFVLFGPRHVHGVPQVLISIGGLNPSTLIHAGTHISGRFETAGGYFGRVGPSIGYAGYSLLAVVVLSVFVWFRVREAWVVAIVGFVAWMLSFGIGFELRHPHLVRWWLPWPYLRHLPLVADIYAPRFAVITGFSLAFLLAVGLDRCWWLIVAMCRELYLTRPNHAVAFRIMGWVAVVVVGVVAILPIATSDAFPYAVHRTQMNQWYAKDAPKLPLGTVIEAYPAPQGFESPLLAWQAVDRMRFSLVNGYAVVPGQDGRSQFVDPPTGPDAALAALSGSPAFLPSGRYGQLEKVRALLVHRGAKMVVVVPSGQNYRFAEAYFTATLGANPEWIDGAWVWKSVPGDRRRPISLKPGVLERCSGLTHAGPMAISDCVLAHAPTP